MADLIKKLGIRETDRVCLLEAPLEAATAIRQACPQSVLFFEDLGHAPYEVIFFWPLLLPGLNRHFAELQNYIFPAGSIWAVMPKKKFAPARGVAYTWEEMQAAGLETDLVDNKIASITEEDYGTRFVIRKDRRARYGG